MAAQLLFGCPQSFLASRGWHRKLERLEERLAPVRLIAAMADAFEETRHGSSRAIIASILILAVLAAAGVGASVWWRNSGQSNETATTASAQRSDETRQALAALGQTVREIQASQQQMAARLDGIKRQLDAEGGERKLLSEQVGALSSRLDSLVSSSASVSTTPSRRPPPAKKKPKPALDPG